MYVGTLEQSEELVDHHKLEVVCQCIIDWDNRLTQGCLLVYVQPYGLVHLDFCLPIDYENLGDVEKGMSDWLLEKVKSFQHFVGGFGDVFEEELMPLFTAIEADRYWQDGGN